MSKLNLRGKQRVPLPLPKKNLSHIEATGRRVPFSCDCGKPATYGNGRDWLCTQCWVIAHIVDRQMPMHWPTPGLHTEGAEVVTAHE